MMPPSARMVLMEVGPNGSQMTAACLLRMLARPLMQYRFSSPEPTHSPTGLKAVLRRFTTKAIQVLRRCSAGSDAGIMNRTFDWTRSLSQHQVMQIPLHDHVLHTLHSLVEQVRVGGVGVVHIRLLRRIAYQVLELLGEEFLACFDVSLVTVVVWEMFFDRCFAGLDLLTEEVHLVQKEDERRLLEVFAVCYAFEQHQSLVHLVLRYVSRIWR